MAVHDTHTREFSKWDSTNIHWRMEAPLHLLLKKWRERLSGDRKIQEKPVVAGTPLAPRWGAFSAPSHPKLVGEELAAFPKKPPRSRPFRSQALDLALHMPPLWRSWIRYCNYSQTSQWDIYKLSGWLFSFLFLLITITFIILLGDQQWWAYASLATRQSCFSLIYINKIF